jgi:hypothetical protein
MERLRTKVAVCLLALLLAGHFMPCHAVEAQKRSRRLWWTSVALVVAANVMDVLSSRGKMEANPLLRGQSGNFNTGRAVWVKSIATGGILAAEALMLRRSRNSTRGAAVVNIITAGVITGVAVRNLTIPRAEPTEVSATLGRLATGKLKAPQAESALR